jgi:FkbM family methyltransferase
MRVWLIGNILRLTEKYFFDPKLKKTLKYALQELDTASNFSRLDEIVCFDIGANRGQSARIFRRIFPLSVIYSFEPDPIIFEKLASNLYLDADVKCFNFAVGDISGNFPFWICRLDETSTLQLPNLESDWHKKKALILGIDPQEMYKKVQVEVITLDEFVSQNEIKKIDVLKIDVEGAELKVLLGGRRVFQLDKVKIVQLEIHHDDLRPSIELQIDSFLAEYGFIEYAKLGHAFGDFSDKIFIKYEPVVR